MNIKQKIVSAIKFKKVDHIPIMYRGVPPLTKKLMNYFNIGKTDDPIRLVRNYKELLKALKADYWTLGSAAYFSNFCPAYTGPEMLEMDRDYYTVLGIKASGYTIEQYDFTYENIGEGPFSSYDRFDKIKGYLTSKLELFDYKNSVNVLLNTRKQSEYYGSDIAEKILDYDNLKENDEDIITTGNVMTNPFILCSYLRGMDNFLMDLAGNKFMAEAVINEVREFLIEFNSRSLEDTRIEPLIFAAWDDVAGQQGLMFSPEIFKRYFLPFWKDLILMAKRKGLYFIWHCCGNINDVLPSMIEAGIDAFDVVQTSARDMEIEKYFKKFGKDVCIHGGIDVQKLLIQGRPEDIKEEIKKIKELWGNNGGAIVGPSHEMLPDTPIENILAMYESLNE